MRKLILVKYGFKEASSIGTYLSNPLTGKSPRVKDYKYLIEKVQSKLAHWKSNQLSFAGKVTLAKATIEALPTYNMMSVAIPQECIKKTHQHQRSFIWGDSLEKKNLHSIH